jgi:hypothetical protein
MAVCGIYYSIAFEDVLLTQDVWMQNISITVLYYNCFNVIHATHVVRIFSGLLSYVLLSKCDGAIKIIVYGFS